MSHIAIVGSGNFGANAALYLAEEKLGQITLIDIKEGLAAGKALDLMEAAPTQGYVNWICGAEDIGAIAGADIIVVASGTRRKPGMTREDLLPENYEVMKPIFENIRKLAPDAIVIIQPQPVDLLSCMAIREYDLNPKKVLGLSSMLDTARFRFFMSQAAGVSPIDASAMVIGRHGHYMVPLAQYASISGIPLSDILSSEKIDEVIEKTRKAGDQIVDLLKVGAAYYAPATCLVEMVQAIRGAQRRYLPISTLPGGAYGIDDVCIGMPVVLSADGIEKVVELDLTEEQRGLLTESADNLKKIISNFKETAGKS